MEVWFPDLPWPSEVEGIVLVSHLHMHDIFFHTSNLIFKGNDEAMAALLGESARSCKPTSSEAILDQPRTVLVKKRYRMCTHVRVCSFHNITGVPSEQIHKFFSPIQTNAGEYRRDSSAASLPSSFRSIFHQLGRSHSVIQGDAVEVWFPDPRASKWVQSGHRAWA